jgi:DNA-binding transcriptional LysR family regulator
MDHISRVGIFIEVVKHQSFIAAARALGTTGPAVSKQIKALEEQLGVKLFHRTTRKVSLTEEGLIYSERAAQALDDLSEAEQQIQDLRENPKGRLKINAPTSLGKQYMTEFIAKFAYQYSDVEVEVDFDDRYVDVIAEGYDVVIRIDSLEDSSLVARKLSSCPILLCVAPSCIENYGELSSVDDLNNYPAVIYNQHGYVQNWQYQDKEGNKGSARLKKNFAANNAEMMLEACRQGLGVGLIPLFAAKTYLNSGELIVVLPELETYPKREIYAMFPQNRYLSTKVRLFVDGLVELGKSFNWE